MNYVKTALTEEFTIKDIVTIHYFEFAKDYIYEGESHNFWEFVYVDKGEVEIMAGTEGYKLKQGDVIFHKPNEFHNLWANGKAGPNLMVISFFCSSPSMSYFENKILSIGENERLLLAKIKKEAEGSFSSPLYVSTLEKLEKREITLFGGEQLIKLYLEMFLIYLVRKGSSITKEIRLSSAVKERSEESIVNKIVNYLQSNIYDNITFEDVCKFAHMSKTTLKTVFKSKSGTGVIEYYKLLKIEEAKKLMREEALNFTEISEKLGYSSVHYFSKHFKKSTGMTPTEYICSIKSIS
ncbi:helix-turn-helix domain-containing protein [Anaerocolumna sedimenticola]|uniref:Helix-turn-helix domain-containing protein n=1 Tax=Anaerocolumna sedimenticola TaxID=2696063 RepID=A0A6P1TM56_9FIRM|nr:AraC family transcriptional regulator [Anaerocolumna sedimenticola]QHQ61533.1 helix-turn-helix domain-containing protein [Anaerocolumna sedimenticola]